jgi:hypothetical protein
MPADARSRQHGFEVTRLKAGPTASATFRQILAPDLERGEDITMFRTTLLVASAGFLLASASFGQTIQSVSGLMVIDANGKSVGSVIAPDTVGTNAVALQVDGHVFLLNFTRTTITARTARIFFESSNCTGTAYLDTSSDGINFDALIPESVIAPPGQTVYVADTTDTPTRRMLGSQFGLTTDDCVPTPSVLRLTVVRALPLLDLATNPFAPPFRVAAAQQGGTACCGDCNGDGNISVDEIIAGVNNDLNGCPR